MKEYFDTNPDNKLIHFTNSIETLTSIISDSHFILKYCKEEFRLTNEKTISSNAHPMVSFSEQNIKKLSNKKITYGKYGIALTSKWIIEKNIQPVMYIEKNSEVAKAIASLLKYRKSTKKGNTLRYPIMIIKGFIKNTIGYNSYLNKKNFVFKEENEWRYLPNKKDIGGEFISESRSVYNKNYKAYNDRIKKYPLKFDHNDIDSIFYDTKEDLTTLKNKFPKLESKFKLAKWKKNRCK